METIILNEPSQKARERVESIMARVQRRLDEEQEPSEAKKGESA